MSEKRKVFVSYSRKDIDKVSPLVKNLEESIGTKFWIDLEGIESTAQFLNVIRQAIEDSQVVLFMLSGNSINGEWTQREIMFAKECGKRVVPVILDGGGLRDWTKLYFANVNYVDAKNKHQIEKLSNEITEWIEPEVNTESTDGEPETTPAPHSAAIKKVLSKLVASLKTIILVVATLIVIFFVIGICSKDDEEETAQSAESSIPTTAGTINGHDYVDLGLSVKWATCNVGASSPEGYGDYYAWGETIAKTIYQSEECETFGKHFNDITSTTHDVAHMRWGEQWRMPTKEEFNELYDENNCKWHWTTENGVNGYKVTSLKNGYSIFLPAAGYISSAHISKGKSGFYWSSTPDEGYNGKAYYLSFFRREFVTSSDYRYFLASIRPVTD